MWKPRTDKLRRLGRDAKAKADAEKSPPSSVKSASLSAPWEKMKAILLDAHQAAASVDGSGETGAATAATSSSFPLSSGDITSPTASSDVAEFNNYVKSSLDALMMKVKGKVSFRRELESLVKTPEMSPDHNGSSPQEMPLTRQETMNMPLDMSQVGPRRRSSAYVEFVEDDLLGGGRRDSFEEALQDEEDPLADPISDLILLFQNAKMHLNKNYVRPDIDAYGYGSREVESDSDDDRQVQLIKPRETNVQFLYEQLAKAENVAKRVINSVIVKQNIITNLREDLEGVKAQLYEQQTGERYQRLESMPAMSMSTLMRHAKPDDDEPATPFTPAKLSPVRLSPVPSVRSRSAVSRQSTHHGDDDAHFLNADVSRRESSVRSPRRSNPPFGFDEADLEGASVGQLQAYLDKAKDVVNDIELRLERAAPHRFGANARTRSPTSTTASRKTPSFVMQEGPRVVTADSPPPWSQRQRRSIRRQPSFGADVFTDDEPSPRNPAQLSPRSTGKPSPLRQVLQTPESIPQLVSFSKEMNWINSPSAVTKRAPQPRWCGAAGLLGGISDKMLLHNYYVRLRSFPLLKRFGTLQRQLQNAHARGALHLPFALPSPCGTPRASSAPRASPHTPLTPRSRADRARSFLRLADNAPPERRNDWASFQEACAYVEAFVRRNPEVASDPVAFLALLTGAHSPSSNADIVAIPMPGMEVTRPDGHEAFQSDMAQCLQQLQVAVRSTRSGVAGLAHSDPRGHALLPFESVEVQTEMLLADVAEMERRAATPPALGALLAGSGDFPTRPGTQQTTVSFAQTLSTEMEPMDHVQYVVPPSEGEASPMSDTSRPSTRSAMADEAWDEEGGGDMHALPRGLLVPTRRRLPSPYDYEGIRPSVTHIKLLPTVKEKHGAHLRESVRDQLGLRREGTPAAQTARGRMKLMRRQSSRTQLPSLRKPSPGACTAAPEAARATTAAVCTLSDPRTVLSLTV